MPDGRSRRFTVRRIAVVGATLVTALAGGAGTAFADPSQGEQLVAQCGDTSYTVISPRPQAAAGQDIESTQVLVIPQVVFRSERLPERLVTFCSVTVDGQTFEVPFLITPPNP
jgi:hypothetical protein